MNTANPQLEGLYLAVAAINRLLVEKGVLSHGEIQGALQAAERTVLADDKPLAVSTSHQKAIAFPIRLLLLANEASEQGTKFCFEDLAREVGRRT
ncbi:Hypothetical protein NGAL_HAMBI2610_09050 [Neorhizobium galegae bv. orientalis]|uniref:hypothetical protein n=1 Tax=Neorhizobium sp. 2083 TaxID=2817762 RepID=UPI000621C74A|nr:hypothetical protein [Neorhizobium sp. 2083]MDR6816878.1 hypothetical protein [Neorhizobium sp. 2083]CDZ69306.1 Hypothetical protein NGAL_HAMBI2610_09050 [Neorhizobium galegae bv. orientalis]